MSLPPLDERASTVLRAERDRLKDTYNKCAEALGPVISPSGARALNRIDDAVEAIEKELFDRAS